jgi:hypothetical protein
MISIPIVHKWAATIVLASSCLKNDVSWGCLFGRAVAMARQTLHVQSRRLLCSVWLKPLPGM